MGVRRAAGASPPRCSGTAAPPASRPRSSSAARCRASARCPGTLAEIAERARGGRRAAAGRDGRRAGRGPARAARLVRARAAARQAGRGHPGARAGERAGRATSSDLGAEVVEVPAIRIEPRIDSRRGAAARCAALAAERVRRRVPHEPERRGAAARRRSSAEGLDARALAGVTVAAIGPGHGRRAARGRRRGRRRAGALDRRVARRGADRGGRRAASACWSRAPPRRATCCRDELRERRRGRGGRRALRDGARAARRWTGCEQLAGADYVTFTSSSTVRFLLESIGGAERFPRGPRVVSIGPVTSDTARELGLEVHVEARAPRRRRPRRGAAGRRARAGAPS